jgi:hypothetical protein
MKLADCYISGMINVNPDFGMNVNQISGNLPASILTKYSRFADVLCRLGSTNLMTLAIANALVANPEYMPAWQYLEKIGRAHV